MTIRLQSSLPLPRVVGDADPYGKKRTASCA